MSNNRELDVLIELMAKLPGLGPRSARRAVLHLIRKRNSLLLPLADMLSNLSETAKECLNCGNITTTDLCEICSDQKKVMVSCVSLKMFQIYGQWSEQTFSKVGIMF